MNFVYPYRQNESEELEWSIKSVIKNAEVHDIVLLVDDNPTHEETLHGGRIITVPTCEWFKYSPYHNVINKLITACFMFEEFILMNDDFFIMKPYDLAKYYNRGNMLDHLNSRKYDSYTRALKNTRNLLVSRGYTDIDFELHVPMLINSRQMLEVIEEITPQLRNSQSILIRSYYGNKFGLVSEHMGDVKNPDTYEGMASLSTNEQSFAGELGNYIKEKLS